MPNALLNEVSSSSRRILNGRSQVPFEGWNLSRKPKVQLAAKKVANTKSEKMKTIPSESRPSWPRNLGRYSAFLNYWTNLKNANYVIRFIISAKSILNCILLLLLHYVYLFYFLFLFFIRSTVDRTVAGLHIINAIIKKKKKKNIYIYIYSVPKRPMSAYSQF